MDWQQVAAVEGRVHTRGEEEHSGRNYLFLESTAAKVGAPALARRRSSVVRWRLFDVVDHEDGHGALVHHQFQAELFLNSFEK